MLLLSPLCHPLTTELLFQTTAEELCRFYITTGNFTTVSQGQHYDSVRLCYLAIQLISSSRKVMAEQTGEVRK